MPFPRDEQAWSGDERLQRTPRWDIISINVVAFLYK